jgi:hypothetical protein
MPKYFLLLKPGYSLKWLQNMPASQKQKFDLLEKIFTEMRQIILNAKSQKKVTANLRAHTHTHTHRHIHIHARRQIMQLFRDD